MTTVKDLIIERLRATGREHIEDVINYMEKHGFFTIGCHRHHKYVGGLADHAWQTYQAAQKFEQEQMTTNPRRRPLDPDSLAICSLLHDICDCNHSHGAGMHGLKSAITLLENGLFLSKDEYLAVRYHMSLRNHTQDVLYPDANRNQLRYVVHKADGISAGKKCGFEI